MLLVSKVRAGGHLYYLETAGTKEHRGVEPPGYWLGTGVRAAGLHATDPVEAEALEAMLQGRHPRSGEHLGADRRRVSVAGFDLTFCAPKSVSLMQALGEPEVSRAVRSGHDRAVAEAVAYVEGRALAVRREVPGAGRVPVPVQAVPAAAFVHHTSRALDPHLHTHVVLANVGRGPDGAWSALDGRGLYAHRGAADALYHAQLRHELTGTLGVAWEAPSRGRADVIGVGEEVRRVFSRRSAQIAADLAARGSTPGDGRLPSGRATALAALVTRSPKDLSVTVEQLRPEWRHRAKEAGLGPRRLEAVLDRVPPPNRALPRDDDALSPLGVAAGTAVDRRLAAAVAEALEVAGAPGSARTFARRHVVRAWASTRERGEPARAVEEQVDRFLSSAGVVRSAAGPGSDRAGPGVAEPRHLLADLFVERDTRRRRDERAERRVLEEVLVRRGMSLADDGGPSSGRQRAMGLDR